MNIEITGRHMEISRAIRSYAEEKAQRLERYFDRIVRLRIILESEGDDRHKAEIVISVGKGATLVSHSSESTMFAAIDIVLDKAERQLTKHKEKLKDHRVKREIDPGQADEPDETEEYVGDI